MHVAFDFDDTLCRAGQLIPGMAALLRRLAAAGHRISIVTARTEAHERAFDCSARCSAHPVERTIIAKFLVQHGLQVSAVYFAEHQPKLPILLRERVDIFIDNEWAEIEPARKAGILAIHVRG